MKSYYGLIVALMILPFCAPAEACTLKQIPIKGSPGCFGFVGFDTSGKRVGFYRTRGMLVGTGSCPSTILQGSMASANQVTAGGSTRTLAADCRSSN